MEECIIHYLTKKIMKEVNYVDEIWKPINDYEGYEVSNYGRVRSINRNIIDKNGKTIYRNGKLLSQNKINSGYLMVDFNINGIHKRELVHRLVAKAFISNPDNLPEINHKDENKLNNHIDNLEWCDGKFNKQYSDVFNKGGQAVSKSIKVIDPCGKETIYKSIAEASRATGFKTSAINWCIKDNRPNRKGYRFIYD